MEPSALLELASLPLGTTPEQLLRQLLLAARALPLIVLVPVFALRGAPLPLKFAMAFALVATVLPTGVEGNMPSEPWPLLIARELVAGLPIALGAAALLWAATMAGDVVADSYQDTGAAAFDAVPGARSGLGVLFSLLGAAGFIEVGGPARLLRALAASPSPGGLSLTTLGSKQWWLQIVTQVLGAIDLALAIAGPLLAVSFVSQVAVALTLRASLPLSLGPALPALRAVIVLLLFGLLFQAVALALFEQLDLRLP
ncbi:MAG TPA: flagellar biosynthetic protein FliR [Polyangiaceae bacterium]|nr:flagellar biosynthetic protein FliR [Polyangiaceae bacterium]